MKARLEGRAIDLADRDLLGVGGEARVYRLADRALKIFHPIDPKLPRSARDLAERELQLKLAKIASFPRRLPPAVVAPRQLVYDARGKRPIGYAMELVDGAQDLLRLSQRRWREGVVSNQLVTALFRQLYLTLEALHTAGVLVGDLNDANGLFTLDGGPRVWLIDADSMQFGGFPCTVGHERFLDPRLYGVDLTAAPSFDEGSDWYAFCVQLLSSLLYVHPYGGIHPSYPTLLRRAEAGVSVLRDEVELPKSAVGPRVLPDELRDHLEAVFDRGERGPFPARLLEMQWSRCRSCGLEHARPVCPDCASRGVVVDRPASVTHGRCRARLIFDTTGRIICAAVQGPLAYLYEQRGTVRREDGRRVLEQAVDPAMRFAINSRSTWIGRGRQLVRVAQERAAERTSTGRLDGVPAFAANAASCFRLDNGWLVDHASGARCGQVLENQTWLRVGERFGFGFYRAGLLTVYFIFDCRRPGLISVELPTIDGRLIEAEAVFDDEHVLFAHVSERDGRRTGSLQLLDRRGRLLGRRSGSPEEERMLASAAGKVLHGGRMICATEDGLLSLRVDRPSGLIVEGTLFADTQPFVSAEVDLLPGPGGSVYVVTTKRITQLSLA